MKLDPSKRDFSRLVDRLKRLSELNPPGKRDWAADTIATLQSGRLESWDLQEFVVDRYDTQLAAAGDDRRPVWEVSRALLALIAELDALKLGAPKTEKIRQTLESWTLE